MMRHQLRAKLHVSWFVAAWSLGVVLGVVLVANVSYGFFASWGWLMAGLVILSPLFFVRKHHHWILMAVVLSGVIIGLWRGSIGQSGLDNYQQLYGKEVMVKGVVLEDPDIDKRGNTVLRLSDLRINERQITGIVWVSMVHSDVIKRSDIVTVCGKLSEGFGAFAARISRARLHRVERPVPGDVAVGVRDWFAERVRMHMPDTESSLGLGFLLGLRRALPADLSEDLKVAGLTHIIVASGYNLTILVQLARRLFCKKSKYLSMLSASLMIIGFMALTGLSPSMSRAGLVAGMSLAAWYYGRTIHPLVLLPVAAAITLLINPQFGWNDLGWQLSFAAFAGVIILAPLLQRYFFGKKEPGMLRQIFGETLSAQIMTTPLLIGAFGVVSAVALAANMLILPFVPLAMLLTFLVGLFAPVPIIGEALAIPTTWLLGYMVQVARMLAGQEWSQLELSLQAWQIIFLYAILGFIIWWLQRQTKLRLRQVSLIE